MASDSDDLAQDIDVLAASQNLPTLTLVMDQGTVGTAAIAFLRTLGRGFTVHCDFDKFHRVHRDMTLAQSLPDDKKRLFQSQMNAQYWWGINYKPFGSGQFFWEKNAALESFMKIASVVACQVFITVFKVVP